MASKKNILKNAGIALLVILVLIQLYRPARNLSNDNTHAISTKYPLPDSVESILKASCYDCHSNKTVYPQLSMVCQCTTGGKLAWPSR